MKHHNLKKYGFTAALLAMLGIPFQASANHGIQAAGDAMLMILGFIVVGVLLNVTLAIINTFKKNKVTSVINILISIPFLLMAIRTFPDASSASRVLLCYCVLMATLIFIGLKK